MKTNDNVTVFQKAGDFSCRLRTTPVAAPLGLVHLQIATRWSKARNPNEDRVQLNLCLNGAELQTLIDGLQQALAQLAGTAGQADSKELA